MSEEKIEKLVEEVERLSLMLESFFAEGGGGYGESFVNSNRLLEILFPDSDSRPSHRWLMGMQSKRLIPFRKIGRKVYYDPREVRRFLDETCTVDAVGARED